MDGSGNFVIAWEDFSLFQNYPNPFSSGARSRTAGNPSTTLEFALPKASFVTLKIYNTLGEEVATLVSEKLPAGKHQRVWDTSGLASGLYLYRLQMGEFVQTKKLILLRWFKITEFTSPSGRF